MTVHHLSRQEARWTVVRASLLSTERPTASSSRPNIVPTCPRAHPEQIRTIRLAWADATA
jgi:hypothetical protein